METFECVPNDLRISFDSKFIRLTPPPATSEKPPTNPPLDQMSLVDRMREVQTLMLEIHQLESDPGPNEFQSLVTPRIRMSRLLPGPTFSICSRRPGFIVYRCNEVDFGIGGTSQTAALLKICSSSFSQISTRLQTHNLN